MNIETIITSLLVIDTIVINMTIRKIIKTHKKQLKYYDDLKESIGREKIVFDIKRSVYEEKIRCILDETIKKHECMKCACKDKPKYQHQCKIVETTSTGICYAKDKQYVIDRLKTIQSNEKERIIGILN